MVKIKITISTERGDRTIEVDPRVAGCLANGAMDGYEELHDGHGKLVNPEDESVADDLKKVKNLLRPASNS